MAIPVVVAAKATTIARGLGTTVAGLKSRLSNRAVWGTLAAGAVAVGVSEQEAFEVFEFLSGEKHSSHIADDGFSAETAETAEKYIRLRASLLDDFAVIDSAIVAAGGVDRFRALRRALTLPDETVQAWALERRRS